MSTDVKDLELALAAATTRADQVELSVRLSAALVMTDPPSALAHAQRAERIARERNAHDELMRATLAIGNCHAALSDHHAALHAYTEMLEHATIVDEPRMMIRAHGGIGQCQGRLGRYKLSVRSLERARTLAVQLDDLPIQTTIANALAGIYSEKGDFVLATEEARRCLAIAEQLADESMILLVTGNLGVIYLELEDFSRSREQFVRAVDMAIAQDDPHMEMLYTSNLGTTLQHLDELDEALVRFERGRELGRQLHVPTMEASALSGLGVVYTRRGMHDRALVVLHEALALAEGVDHATQYTIRANIGTIELERGRTAEGIALLEAALEGVRASGRRPRELDLLTQIADAYERIGDAPRALEFFKAARELRREMIGQEKQRQMMELEIRAEIERAERERSMLRERARSLEEEMRTRTQELGSLAMSVVETDELLVAVRREMSGVAGTVDDEARPKVEDLRQQIDVAVGDAEKGSFEAQYAKVHGDVIARLFERHPDLTRTELKVCALLRLNMATKEIAEMLSSSARTVETHRLRIRRKLALPEDVTMAGYLASI